jgi:transposase
MNREGKDFMSFIRKPWNIFFGILDGNASDKQIFDYLRNELIEKGHSLDMIASQIKISPKTVHNIAKYFELDIIKERSCSKDPIKEIHHTKEILDCRRKGWTTKRICDKFGIKAIPLYNLLKENGLVTIVPNRRLPDKTVKKVLIMYRTIKSYRRIAKELNLPIEKVKHVIDNR